MIHWWVQLDAELAKSSTIYGHQIMIKTRTIYKFMRQLLLPSVLYRHWNPNSYRISNSQLERYISKIGHPQLCHLSLWRCPLINGDFVTRLDYIFNSLTELKLSSTSISDNDISVLWELSSRHNILKEMISMNCGSLTDGLANKSSLEIKSLGFLEVSSHLSVDTMEHSIKHTRNLIALDLDGIVLE